MYTCTPSPYCQSQSLFVALFWGPNYPNAPALHSSRECSGPNIASSHCTSGSRMTLWRRHSFMTCADMPCLLIMPNPSVFSKFSRWGCCSWACVAHAGRVAGAEDAVSKDDFHQEGDVDFCNTPEGYCEMGKQLGLAFASMFCNACTYLAVHT